MFRALADQIEGAPRRHRSYREEIVAHEEAAADMREPESFLDGRFYQFFRCHLHSDP